MISFHVSTQMTSMQWMEKMNQRQNKKKGKILIRKYAEEAQSSIDGKNQCQCNQQNYLNLNTI